MNDYINREMAADSIVLECDNVTLEQARQAIKDVPSADVVEVVRCKDCEHCEKRRTANYQPFFYCLMQECSIKDDDYCSYGERKDHE